jgi:ubiquitin-like protein Pup
LILENQTYFESDDDSERSKSTEEEVTIETDSGVDASELSSDLDGLLDEIDQVLESNAEEFVKSYVQKGGQ